MYTFEEMGFGYSEAGLAGRVELLEKYVDVSFYFEDQDKECFYEVLVNTLFPGLVTEHVFCLGGKTNVLAEAVLPNKKGGPRIFLLDKDFDDLLSKLNNDPEGVVRFRAYSIENYFLEMGALAKALAQFSDIRLSEIKNRSELAGELKRIFENYKQMSKLFFAVQKFGLKHLQTTKKPYKDFLEGEGVEGIMPDSVIKSYVATIKKVAVEQSNRLENETIVEAELKANFDHRNGCTPRGDPRFNPNFPGKQLFRLMCELFDRALGSKLQEVSAEKLMLAVMPHIADFRNRFEEVIEEVTASVDRQRTGSP